MVHEPKKGPSKPLPKSGVGDNQQTVDVLSRSLTAFFKEILRPDSNWSRPTDQQFLEAIAEAMVSVGNESKDGWGFAMLQTFVFDLQELINARINSDQPHSYSRQAPGDRLSFRPSEGVRGTSDDVLTWDVASGFDDESTLHRLGYSVATGGPNSSKRRSILRDAFLKSALPGLKSEVDQSRWGIAESAQRLYAISRFLNWLCEFQGKEKPMALRKWQDDLAWLKASFYEPEMQFSWPDAIDTGQHKSGKIRSVNAAFMRELTPSIALSDIVGSDPIKRTDVVKKIWVYIKNEGLQDQVNKRCINADSKLKKIFGKSQVTIFEMAGLLGKHLS